MLSRGGAALWAEHGDVGSVWSRDPSKGSRVKTVVLITLSHRLPLHRHCLVRTRGGFPTDSRCAMTSLLCWLMGHVLLFSCFRDVLVSTSNAVNR